MTISGSNTNTKIKLHLIMAMHAEAAFVINKLNLQQISSENSMHIYHADVNEYSIHLFVNQKKDGMDKIGTVHAAILTYKAITFLKPDIILSIGTSGGIVAHQVKLFDLICADPHVIYHDRFSGEDANALKQSLVFAPAFNLISEQFAANSLIKFGVVGSSNSLRVPPKNWAILYKYRVLCVDMEAAAVAEIADEFKVPFCAIKVVTDEMYEVNPVDAFSEFVKNFDRAMNILSSWLKDFLNHSQLQFDLPAVSLQHVPYELPKEHVQ